MRYSSIHVPGLDVDAREVREALVEFVQVQVSKAGLPCVVLGLSGGLDSSVAAYILAEALGPERVFAAILPYRTSSADSLEDAKEVARLLELDHATIDITPMVDAYLNAFPRSAGPAPDDVRRGNIMARQRMAVLYDLSAARRAMVVGTSNKTELLLGYGTLHGDLAFAFDPLGDLYKTQVRALARYIGVPDRIIAKPPSADLWAGQTDEEDLGFAYEDVDKLLYLMVDERKRRSELISAGFDPEFVDSVRARVRAYRFKTRMPAIARILRRGIGGDYRYWPSTTSRKGPRQNDR